MISHHHQRIVNTGTSASLPEKRSAEHHPEGGAPGRRPAIRCNRHQHDSASPGPTMRSQIKDNNTWEKSGAIYGQVYFEIELYIRTHGHKDSN